MRIGVMLEPAVEWSFESLRELGGHAEAVGLDVCWIRSSSRENAWSAAALAASLGSVTSDIRLAIELGVGDHPIELAEELIVADLATCGRVVGVIDAEGAPPDLVDETLEILLASLAPRPFTHSGARWSVPRSGSGKVRVTPAPAQLELPLHLLRSDAAEVAHRFGIPPVVGSHDDASTASALWSTLAALGAPSWYRSRRIAVRAWDGGTDAKELVHQLRAEQRHWGMDTCVIDLAHRSTHAEVASAIEELGTVVRPRLQLESVPLALEDMWDRANADQRP